MGQIAITTRIQKVAERLSKREHLLVMEIGMDRIDSASAFVNYISESYGFSKSAVWYNLNRLKEKKVLDFATKDEPGKALVLTKGGIGELRTLARSGVKLGILGGSAPALLPNCPVDSPNDPIADRIRIPNVLINARMNPGRF